MPPALILEWQLLSARWLAIALVLLALSWLQLSERELTSALLIVGFGALFDGASAGARGAADVGALLGDAGLLEANPGECRDAAPDLVL